MERAFNVYIIGVGGQGIGLLSEAVARAADHGALEVRGVDTHGLAQRGGIVVSHVRIGRGAFSPLVMERSAHLVAALERNEALRAMNSHLMDGGTLAYYDAVWQPLLVRLGRESPVSREALSRECARRSIREERVLRDDLDEARMQNVALLARISSGGLIPGLSREHYEAALADLLDGAVLQRNLELFRAAHRG